jgi:2-polyprenyl-6-methoxyphenol hydroxylase-like FAD-dependent oxidoreductase
MASITHSPRTALVIGCGIGGPVAALALQKAGIEPAIFEAYDGDAEFVGSFLNLASNGLDALDTIGVRGAVANRGFATPRMVMWSGSGKLLGEVANGLTREGRAGSITIERGRLHAALRAAAESHGIPIHRGRRLVDVATANGQAVARFSDGSGAAADVIVGADGLHSQVRRLIDPQAPSPRYSGQLSLGGRAELQSLQPSPGVFHMVFGRRAFFGYSVPIPGTVYWFANVEWPDQPDRAALGAITPARWRERLSQLFENDESPACRIVSATGNDLGAYPIFDMPTVRHWHRDGMVIIGDAAHATSPSSGQGASMAIEDAVTLARCLRDVQPSADAFAAYDRLRRARVERVVAYSARIGQSKTPGPIGRWFRDLFMPVALKLVASPAAQAWLYDHSIDWSARVAA